MPLTHPDPFSSLAAMGAACALGWVALALLALAWLRRRPADAAIGAVLAAAAVWLSTAGTALPGWLAALVLAAVAVFVIGAARLYWWQQQQSARWRALWNETRQAAETATAVAQAQQAAAQGRADAADAARIRFLAAASHDLRQPAAALGLHLDALRAGSLTAQQSERAQNMAQALSALQTLTTALLDMSRLQAGAVLPRWDVVALVPLLRRLADEVSLGAERRGLRLALHVQDTEAAAVTDTLLLERVLRNLLDNALKYTHQGGVLLACRRRKAADGTFKWRLEVWDSGPGMDPVHHDRIFEAYEQIGQRGNDGQGHGAGLGLALVRELVQQLQLQLVLHSRPGRGSVFFVEGLAPVASGPRQVAAARASLSQGAAPTMEREA